MGEQQGRHKHMFRFPANEISKAADDEMVYHAERLDYWEHRQERSVARLEETIGAKIVKAPVTGGMQHRVVVDYGDANAHHDLQLSDRKIEMHRRLYETFQAERAVYGSQGTREYELTVDDVEHFRLGGSPRPDDNADDEMVEY